MTDETPTADAAPEKGAPAPATLLRAYGFTLAMCALMVALCIQRGAATFLVVFILVLLPATLYSLVKAIRNPRQRKWRAAKLGLWVLGIAIVLGMVEKHGNDARAEADAVAAKITSYKKQRGAWPASLEEAGAGSRETLTASRARYGLLEGAPHLMYPHPTIIFDAYVYDFNKQAWKYEPD